MKKIKYIIFAIMLVSLSLFGIRVIAHPPQDMVLDYNTESKVLNVTITHSVSNPNNHYIYKIEIFNNEVEVTTANYNSQPSTTTFTYTYPPLTNAEAGDIIKVIAYCNIQGSIMREITIPMEGNNPPNIPEFNGQTNGEVGIEYTYSFLSIDPDGDDIYYCIQWGDNSGEICLGPFQSGIERTATHTWNEEGTYLVKIKARDINDAESDWATLQVTMPKNKSFKIQEFLINFFENQPTIFQIFRQILGLE